jgi:tetratricopeptide (TPR) repeat protein
MPSTGPDAVVRLRLDHGLALYDVGQAAEGLRCAEDALRIAGEIGDRRSAALARLLRLDLWLADGTLVARDPAVVPELDAALADAEASADPAALAEAWMSISGRHWSEAEHGRSLAALDRALEHAHAAGNVRRQLDIELDRLVHVFAGATPADQVAAQAASLAERASAHPTVRAEAVDLLAVSEAMLGRFEDARAHVEQSIATLADFAQLGSLVNTRTYLAWVNRLAGDLPAAEAVLRDALAEAVEIGDQSLVSFVSCRLAEVLVGQERFDEAEGPLAVAERDPIGATETRIAGARARIRAARGDRAAIADVEALMALVADGPWLNVRTEAYLDAAWTMHYLGDAAAAGQYARDALRMCEEKEDGALAARTRALLSRWADGPDSSS